MAVETPRDDQQVLELVAERATISKRAVQTGLVRVSTHVEEHQELIREALRRDEVVVQRVAIDQIVETPPVVRQEGDTMIYPIVEEVLVVKKRLLLKEELHVIRTSRLETVEQDVTLRAMHADAQRTPTPTTNPALRIEEEL